MPRRRRRYAERRIVASAFDEVLVDLVLNGTISLREAERRRFQLHTHLHLPNLYPSRTPLGHVQREPNPPLSKFRQTDLKFQIMGRLGTLQPVYFPDGNRGLTRIEKELPMRVIVAKKSDHIVDPAFFDAMAKAIKPTYAGTGMFDGKELQGGCYPNVKAAELVAGLKDVSEQFKPHKVIYFFDEDSSEGEDGQPYQLLEDKDGNPALACFVDGEFGDYKSPKEFVTECLIDEVAPVYKTACEGDIVKTMEILGAERFGKKLANFITDGTVILIGACSAEPVILSKGPSKQNYDWGVVSRSCGYGEGIVNKVVNALGLGAKPTEKKATPVEPTIAKTDGPPLMLYKVPSSWSNKNKVRASIIMFGTQLDAYKKGFEKLVTREQFEELNKIAASEANRNDAAGIKGKGMEALAAWKPTEYQPFSSDKSAGANAGKGKDTVPHNLPGSLVTADKIPDARNFLLKHVDRWKNELPSDPAQLPEYEKRLGTILEVTGTTAKVSPRLRYISYDDWSTMMKENPQYAALLAFAVTIEMHAKAQALEAAAKKINAMEPGKGKVAM